MHESVAAVHGLPSEDVHYDLSCGGRSGAERAHRTERGKQDSEIFAAARPGAAPQVLSSTYLGPAGCGAAPASGPALARRAPVAAAAARDPARRRRGPPPPPLQKEERGNKKSGNQANNQQREMLFSYSRPPAAALLANLFARRTCM